MSKSDSTSAKLINKAFHIPEGLIDRLTESTVSAVPYSEIKEGVITMMPSTCGCYYHPIVTLKSGEQRVLTFWKSMAAAFFNEFAGPADAEVT